MSYFKRSKNSCSFIGSIGKDVVVGEDASKSVRFSIATNLVTGKDENKNEKAIWIPLQIWKDHPSVPFLKKGRLISVDGYYDTGESGEGDNKKYFHQFQVTDVVLLDSKSNEGAEQEKKSD